MGALTVLAAVDTFLAKVYGPRKEKKPVMVACSGVDERLEVLIDEARGMRQALEQLVALQAENLRLKVAGPSVEVAGPSRERVLTAGRPDLDELSRLADDSAADDDAAEDQPGIAGRVGRAIKRKVKG